MLFGESGLGGLLEAQGLDAVPSPTWRRPDTCKVNGQNITGDDEVGGDFFPGGYSLQTHGTSAIETVVGDVDAIQIEVGAKHRCGSNSCGSPAPKEERVNMNTTFISHAMSSIH